jgi:hypothetical protein
MTARETLTPARPLPAQVHALHAAAIFLARAATAGLTVTVSDRALISIEVPAGAGDPAARAALVTALAAAADDGHVVRFTALGCRDRYGITGYGQLAGHPVTFITPRAATR